MLWTMKSINHAIHGLASSLLLNVGLTRLAEKLDPVIRQSGDALKNPLDTKSGAFSEFPCNFKSGAFSEFPCNFTPQAAK